MLHTHIHTYTHAHTHTHITHTHTHVHTGNKLVREEGLSARAERTLTDIFLSSLDSQSERGVIPAQQVTDRLQLFLSGYVGGKGSVQEVGEGMCEQQKGLTLERFLHWALKQVDGGVAALWQGLFASGYDLHFVR